VGAVKTIDPTCIVCHNCIIVVAAHGIWNLKHAVCSGGTVNLYMKDSEAGTFQKWECAWESVQWYSMGMWSVV